MLFVGFNNAWPDVVKICFLTVVSSLGVKSLFKGVSRAFKNDEKIFLKLNTIIDEFYLENEKIENHRKVMLIYLKKFKLIIKSSIALMFIFYMGSPLASLYETFVTGEYVLYAPMHFPYTDPKTLAGYLINQAYLTLIPISFFLTINFGEFFNLYLSLQLIPMVEVFNSKLIEFGKELVEFRKAEINDDDSKHKSFEQ